MNIAFSIPDESLSFKEVQPFILFRDHVRPSLEARQTDLDAMYDETLGRPEIDPVFLAGITILQMMERLPDRQTITACRYDARWRLALDIPEDWPGIDPSTLVYFRRRVAEHGAAAVALEAGLEAMRRTGYLRRKSAVRIDSTHILGCIANLSRLECVRETLRLALEFLNAFGDVTVWEPWLSRYAERNPKELRNASVERLRSTLEQAGKDAWAILEKARELGKIVEQAQPIALLQRVFTEQFEVSETGELQQRPSTCSGSVHNPHDPQAEWSTKGTLGKTGWVGYKLQVCETASVDNREPGEPTTAVITAMLTQPAISSDHGALGAVLDIHEQGGQKQPNEVFADAGYISAPALIKAEEEGYVLTGPIGAPPHSGARFGSDSFVIDIPNRQATCPAGNPSSECSRIAETQRVQTYYYFAWPKAVCEACPIKDQCLSKKKQTPFRSLQVGEDHMIVQERRALCKTDEYQHRMYRRSGIEGTHSELARGYNLRRSRYRGLAKTDLHMQFTAAACNLRRWSARLCWINRQKP